MATDNISEAGVSTTAPEDLDRAITQANAATPTTALFATDPATITEAGPVTPIDYASASYLTIDGQGDTLVSPGGAAALTVISGQVMVEALTIGPATAGGVAVDFSPTGAPPSITAAEIVFAPEPGGEAINTSKVTGVIEGAGSITVDATASVTLSAANTYSGKTIISGFLLLDGPGASIAGSHNVTLGATGILSVEDVTAAAGSASATPVSSINELTGVAGSVVELGESSGGVQLTIDENVENAVFAGIFAGDASTHLIIEGANSLTLSAASTEFAGHLEIEGEVILSGVGSISAAHNVSLGAAGMLDVSGVTVPAGSPAGTPATASINELTGLAGSRVVLGAADLTINETVAPPANTTPTFSGVISGAGGVTFDGPQTLTLAGAETYTGPTIVASGALAFGSGGSLSSGGDVTVDGGATLDLSGQGAPGAPVTAAIGSLAGAGVVNLGDNTLDIDQSASAAAFSGVIESAGAAGAKQGAVHIAGDLTLTGGANTYTGSTVVTGTLTLDGGAIAASHNVILGASAVLNVDVDASINELTGVAGSAVVIAPDQTLTVVENVTAASFSGVISGGGSLEIGLGSGATADTLTLTAAETFTGTATIDTGATLSLAPGGSIAGTVDVNGTLDLSAGSSSNTIFNLEGDGLVLLGTSTLVAAGENTFYGVISGAGDLQVGTSTSIGELALGGTNTYTGKTVVYGLLELGGDNTIANSHNVTLGSGSELYLVNSQSIHELTGVASSTVDIDGATLTVMEDVTAASFSGEIVGQEGSSLVIAPGLAGTFALTLNGNNTAYDGSTTIDNGATLALGPNGTLSSLTSSSATFVFGALDISGANADDGVEVSNLSSDAGKLIGQTGTVILGSNTLVDVLTTSTVHSDYTDFGGVISGAGGLTVTTDEGYNLVLTGANTYTGATTLDDALLALYNTTATSGIVLVDGGDIDLDVTGDFATPITGTGMLSIGFGAFFTGGAVTGLTVTLTTAETFTGETSIESGATLALAGAGSIANSYVNVQGVFDVSQAAGKVVIGGFLGDGAVNIGANTVEIIASPVTGSPFSGTLTGSGTLQIDAGGYVGLQSASPFTGKVLVSGELDIFGTGGLDFAHNVSLRSGGQLYIGLDERFGVDTTINELTGQAGSVIGIYTGSTLTVDETVAAATFAGVITEFGPPGSFTLEGANTLTLTGDNTYSGATTIDAGATLAIGSGGSIADSGLVTVIGALDLSAAGPTSLTNLSGSGAVHLGATALTVTETAADAFSGLITGSGSLTVDGAILAGETATTLQLSGASTHFTGGLTISSGAVELSAVNAAGTGAITFNDVGGPASSGVGVLVIDNSGLTSGGATQTFANTIAGVSAVGAGPFGNGGDIIDLTGLTYGNSTNTTASYNASTDVLTVANGTTTVSLHVTGVPAGDTFVAYEDSHGGVFLVLETGAVTDQGAYEASHYHP